LQALRLVFKKKKRLGLLLISTVYVKDDSKQRKIKAYL